MRTTAIVAGAIILIALAYYFLIVRPGKEATGGGSQCDPNRPGFQKDGSLNPSCTGESSSPSSSYFNAGDDVYVPPLRQGYLYIYSYPQNNQSTEIGRTTNSLNGTSPLGKFVSLTNDGRFVRVNISGKTIEKKTVDPSRPGSYSYSNSPVTGDFYVLTEFVSNKL